ncbi:phosphate transport system regulatory protein PhoU [Micromonospora sp. CPCC 205371]|nr:phosphate transport system regulatory protein PhoU [Micromonospora sp. CPCC 205371]
MRDEFHEQLEELNGLLADMTETARVAMRHASAALIEGDRAGAGAAAGAVAAMEEQFRRAEGLAGLGLARQQPPAGDLRLIIASLHTAADLERMGQLAGHVATISARDCSAWLDACPMLEQMAAVGDAMAGKAARAIRELDAVLAAELPADDDRMDALHRELWSTLLSDWRAGVQPAIDAAMLGRFYERFADHAVNAARQVVYVTTGEPLIRSGP